MAKCLDCSLPYIDFGLDMVLPDEQWLMIHPEGLHGILCANCMVKRAEKLTDATVVLANIELGKGDEEWELTNLI